MSTARQLSRPEAGSGFDLTDPSLFINRELSWLRFNLRVLEEAEDITSPLLEQVKFLSIFANNLDEFFMVRVSGLRRQEAAGVQETSADGMTPGEQLREIRLLLLQYIARQCACWNQQIFPALDHAGIHLLEYEQLGERKQELLREYFERQIFPVLIPLAFDPAHPFPHISNLSLNLAVVVNDPQKGERFARLKVPDIFPRFLPIPDESPGDRSELGGYSRSKSTDFVRLEELLAHNLGPLFPGLEVVASYPFRISRDADISIEEDEASDLLSSIEEGIEMREFGTAVRLEVDRSMPERIKNTLINNMSIAPYLVYTHDSILGMADLMSLYKVDRPDLKYSMFIPALPPTLTPHENMFNAIRRGDILLYHPYDSFGPVVEFLNQAAQDPDVLAIKQTLYRVGPNSPVVKALMAARQEGKQVAVVVELKARFDEENNIAWARALENEGVHVIYGVLGLKVHSKLLLVVRREGDRLVRYSHLSSGNYNPITARIYTDLGLFTCDPDIGADMSELFNALTGYSRESNYRRLLVAPGHLRAAITERIDREIERQQTHGDGYIAIKLNALVDRKMIRAFYRASQAGVKVDLQVRGMCDLRPGVTGVSENITVTSIVGRFLEHSRIYYFKNGGDDELLLGSSDLMPRNLYRRVEVLFPVLDPAIKKNIYDNVLHIHLRDNVKSRMLLPDGNYRRVEPAPGEDVISSQEWMLEHWGTGEE